jgi:hypothetical protein
MNPRRLRALLHGLLSIVLIGPTMPAAGGSGTAAEPTDAALAAFGAQAKRTRGTVLLRAAGPVRQRRSRNDRGGYPGDRTKTGYDPTDKGFYHGGDLQGVIDKLDYIQGLGTTAIWLAPVFKNKPVQGGLGRLPRLLDHRLHAGRPALRHQRRPQAAGADRASARHQDLPRRHRQPHRRRHLVRRDQYSYVDKKTSPYVDALGHPFEDANYALGDRAFPAVDRTAGPYTPVVNGNVKKPAWLNDPTMYHNRGDSTFSGENSTYGDFFGLDDLWTERPRSCAA